MDRRPTFPTFMVITSPLRRGPTPAGVPLAITSPGRRVIIRLMKDTSSAGVKVQGDGRTQGAKGVEALGPDVLPVRDLQVAGGHIVQTGVAQDVSQRLGGAHVLASLTDHYTQLSLVVHPPAHVDGAHYGLFRS